MKRRTLLTSVGASGTSVLGTKILESKWGNNRTAKKGKGRKRGIQGYTDDFTTENLGPHNLSLPMASGELIGDTMYIGTRIANPSGIATFNLDSQHGEFHAAANNKQAIWGSTSVNNGDDLYFNTYNKIHHYNINNDQISSVFNMENTHISWDMDSGPGDSKVYVAADTPAKIWEYDPATGEGGYFYGSTLTNSKRTRSISVDTKTVYAGTGGGGDPQLVAVDRETESKEVVLYSGFDESPISDENYVYEVGNTQDSEDYVAFGTHGTPLVGYVNKNDYTDYQVAEIPNIHPVVDSVTIDGATVYVAAKFPATLYQYDISNNEVTRLSEVPGIATRDLHIRNGKVIGVSESNHIWSYSISSGTVESQNVLNISDGIQGVPQVAQSVSGYQGKAYVGASGQTSIHDAESGSITTISAPGEPKTQTWADGVLYQACYSNGDLVRYDPETGSQSVIPRVARTGSTSGRVRPRALHYDNNLELLFIGTKKPEEGSGDLYVFDVDSKEVVDAFTDFFGDEVSAITSLPNNDSNAIFAARNSLVEVNSNTGEKLRTLPSPNGEIRGLTALQRPRPGAPQTMEYIYGVVGTTLFALDPESESLVFEKNLPGGANGKPRSNRGLIFGEGNDAMFVCDPGAEEVSIPLNDLNGDWHNWRTIGIDDNNAYVISGTDLLKVNLPNGMGKYFGGNSNNQTYD